MTQEMNIVYPDIEIYLYGTNSDEIIDWLSAFLTEITATGSAGNRQTSRYTARYEAPQGSAEVQFMIVERAIANFTSLWFKSSPAPWSSDLACARAAARYFPREIRCSIGPWHENQDTDEWIRIENSTESIFTWKS